MKRVILLIVIALCSRFSLLAQGGPMKYLLKEDSVTIYYLANFNYDVVLLYANGIKIDENLLYSQASRNAKKVNF